MATEARQAQTAGQTTTQDPEDFSSLLKQSFKPRTERAASDVENAVSTLVKEALSDQSMIKEDVLDTIEAMIAKLDAKLTEQVNQIIHAPEYQQLESSWRGLNYLVFNTETDTNLKIKVMNVGKTELYNHLRMYPGAKWDQSPLFKQIYESEFGTLGGQPYGSLVGDYYFSHLPKDVQLLRDLSKIAASAHCPFFSAVDSITMGMDSWNDLSKPRDLAKIFDTPEYAGWRGLRDSSDTAYVGLCMPRVLARQPYGAKGEPVEEFAFEEETDGHKGEKFGWMNAAYAMAVNINRAFKEYGWCTKIRGVQSGGEVTNLPTHTFPTDDGDIDQKCPTEISITDRREAELAKAGFIPIIHRKNTDVAAFMGAQSLYKPKTFRLPDDTAADNLKARLPYMFAVCRFAHYLKCMVRDQVGMMMERHEVENWLHTWLMDYVDGNPESSSEETKARRPLAAASVKVWEDEENPGFYGAQFFLRPHYQLEGMDIGLSLVSKLPTHKK